MEVPSAIRIRMLQTVRPDFPFLAKPDSVLWYAEEYDAVSNKYGAISGICENGNVLVCVLENYNSAWPLIGFLNCGPTYLIKLLLKGA